MLALKIKETFKHSSSLTKLSQMKIMERLFVNQLAYLIFLKTMDHFFAKTKAGMLKISAV